MPNKQALSDVDKQLLQKYLVGGAALGGGTAVLTSMLNHWNQLSKERARQQSLDDDVLTVKVRRPGQDVTKQATVTGGLALSGGALSMLASYAAVRKAYTKMKKNRMQDLLDQSQTNFAQSSAEEAEKLASGGRPMSVMDLLTSSPVAAALLLGVGSAGLSNAYLNKTYPATQPARPTKPRKVVLKYVDDEGEDKQASFDELSGFEQLVRTVYQVKQAEVSDLQNIVRAVAEGRVEELADNLSELPAEEALDLIKGASADLDNHQLMLATAIATRHPVVGPTTRLLASADLHDLAPSYCKMANQLEEHDRLALAGLVCEVGRAFRCGEKRATQLVEGQDHQELLQQLAQILQQDPQDPQTEEAEEDLESMSRGGATDNAVDDEETPEEAAQRMGVGSANDDIVDELLGGGQAVDPATAPPE